MEQIWYGESSPDQRVQGSVMLVWLANFPLICCPSQAGQSSLNWSTARPHHSPHSRQAGGHHCVLLRQNNWQINQCYFLILTIKWVLGDWVLQDHHGHTIRLVYCVLHDSHRKWKSSSSDFAWENSFILFTFRTGGYRGHWFVSRRKGEHVRLCR